MQDEEEGEVRRKINTIGQRINPWKKERILLGVEREEFDWIRFSKLNSRCPVKFKLQVNNEQVFSIKYVLYNIWLEKEMAEYSRILAWEIPRTEEPGRLQSMGLQRVGHDWATLFSLFTAYVTSLCLGGIITLTVKLSIDHLSWMLFRYWMVNWIRSPENLIVIFLILILATRSRTSFLIFKKYLFTWLHWS